MRDSGWVATWLWYAVRGGWQRRPITVASYRAKDKWSGRGGKLEGVASRVENVVSVICREDGDVGVDY